VAGGVEFEQWVAFPLGRVFLFFADPNNLPRIMPPASGTHLTELRLVPPPHGSEGSTLAGVGSEIVTSLRLFPFLPFRAEWIARITEFEWNHHFADVQKKGPFKSFHHCHEFAAEERNGTTGTSVRDVIDFDAGFGILGRIVGRLFIRPQLERTFRYRQRALTVLLSEAESFASE
jgi:ligand-binding SRPBCC domain-containing protein